MSHGGLVSIPSCWRRRCGELPTARKILESMENAPGGSTADAWTYNTIIKGLGREQRIEEAFDVVRGMVQRGCWPDEVRGLRELKQPSMA